MISFKVKAVRKRIGHHSAPLNVLNQTDDYIGWAKGVEKEEPAEEVTIELTLHSPSSPMASRILKVTEGGVTGYESMYVDVKAAIKLMTDGWWACAGTVGCYDSLFIPSSSIRLAFETFAILALFETGA